MAVFQSPSDDGRTQAINVTRVTSSAAASGTVTQSLTPSNDSAPPFLPAAACVAPEMVPVKLLPEASAVVVPLVSLKPYAATSPAIGAPSSLVMVTTPWPSSTVAFTGELRFTVNVSFGSVLVSPVIDSVMVCVTTPGAKVSVPDAAE